MANHDWIEVPGIDFIYLSTAKAHVLVDHGYCKGGRDTTIRMSLKNNESMWVLNPLGKLPGPLGEDETLTSGDSLVGDGGLAEGTLCAICTSLLLLSSACSAAYLGPLHLFSCSLPR